ncbi:hypothetical protein D3C75_509420 [compost metagenome]
MFNHDFTTPTRVATSQIRLAITIAVEELRNLRFLQIRKIFDVVSVSSFLIDHIALQDTLHYLPNFDHRVIATALLIKGLVQSFPLMYCEICIPIRQCKEHRWIISLLWLLDVVAKLL